MLPLLAPFLRVNSCSPRSPSGGFVFRGGGKGEKILPSKVCEKMLTSERESERGGRNGNKKMAFTFVDMLGRRVLRGEEEGEKEESEERQSSPLGHHFFTNKSLQASGTPEKLPRTLNPCV